MHVHVESPKHCTGSRTVTFSDTRQQMLQTLGPPSKTEHSCCQVAGQLKTVTYVNLPSHTPISRHIRQKRKEKKSGCSAISSCIKSDSSATSYCIKSDCSATSRCIKIGCTASSSCIKIGCTASSSCIKIGCTASSSCIKIGCTATSSCTKSGCTATSSCTKSGRQERKKQSPAESV